MRKRVLLYAVLGLFAIIAPGLVGERADAYSWSTHMNMVEVGVSAMQQIKNVPDTDLPAPLGVDQASWQTFLADVRSAPAKLEKLRIGTLIRGVPDFNNPAFDDACACKYDGTDNMANVEATRIMDFHYIPNRNCDTGCCLRRFDIKNGVLVDIDPNRVLGGVLGWHAAMVDDHLEDVVGWIRPWNTGVAALLKDWYNKAWEYGVGALVAPFKCFLDWLHGESCDFWREGKELADEINPVNILESVLPGFGDYTSDKWTGLWHFMDPKAHPPFNVYNNVRGMYYPKAGPDGNPGCADYSILGITDVIGLSLNASKSDGVGRYGQFDEVSRISGDWQGQTFGQLEWSPLQNLGRYGWEVFQNDRKNAYGLGWPLHAIADAVQAQHISSTTSYGHVPLEDAIEHNWNALFPGYTDNQTKPITLENNDQLMRILSAGYQAWAQLKSGKSFEDFLIDLGTATRNYMDAFPTVYDDYSSFLYHFVGRQWSAELDYTPWPGDQISTSRFFYMQPAIETGIGSMIGFLLISAELVIDPNYDPTIRCPMGFHYDRDSLSCVAGLLVCKDIGPLPGGIVQVGVGNTCQSVGQPCGFAIVAEIPLECCKNADLTCINNKCVKQGQPPCQGWGETCAANSECCSGLTCVQGACIEFVK